MLIEAADSSLASTYVDAVARYEAAMRMIAVTCGCPKCKSIDDTEQPAATTNEFCKVYLAETVIELVQIVSFINETSKIQPTRAGIENLYWQHYDAIHRPPLFRLLKSHRHSPIDLAKSLFTGRQVPKVVDQSACAVAVDGICLCFDMLRGPSANPEQSNLLHLIPGHIEWNEHAYSEVRDLPGEGRGILGFADGWYDAPASDLVSSLTIPEMVDTSSPDLRCELVVEENETGTSPSLVVTYRFSTAKVRVLSGPRTLMLKINASASSKDCRGKECNALPSFDVIRVHGEGVPTNKGEITSTSSRPLVTVLSRKVPAQLVALRQYSHVNVVNRRVGVSVNAILQHKQCTYCLLMSAIKGPRAECLKRGREIYVSSRLFDHARCFMRFKLQ